MIRISVNTGGEAQITEFEKPEEALDFIQLIVMSSNMPFSFTWEDVKPCEHVWAVYDCDDEKATFLCAYGCKDSRVITQAQITESAKP